jgi:hypothetical protein
MQRLAKGLPTIRAGHDRALAQKDVNLPLRRAESAASCPDSTLFCGTSIASLMEECGG